MTDYRRFGGAQRWSAQVNDLVGGWVVTNYPHPLSQHDCRPDGDIEKRGYVIAECMTEDDAKFIAYRCNEWRLRRGG